MTDSIHRTIDISAPRDCVWDALTDYRQFGEWFKVALERPFEEGKVSNGTIEFNGQPLRFEFLVDRITPKSFFSYRWHPYAVDPKIDYSGEEKTLVEFRLEPIDAGTRLSVTESGFERIPEHRRADALRMNGQGWAIQVERIRDYAER